MKTLVWTDDEQRDWITRCDVSDLRRLLAVGFDLKTPKNFTAIFGEPEELMKLLIEFFRPQFNEAVDEDRFALLLTRNEQSFPSAAAAVVEGLKDLFRRTGELKRITVVEKAIVAIEKEQAAVLALLASPEVDARINREIDKAISDIARRIAE